MKIVYRKGAAPSGVVVPAEVQEAIWRLGEEWGQQSLGTNATPLDLKKLHKPKGFYRLKVGGWRVAFQPVDDMIVVALIGLRDGFYERLARLGTARLNGAVWITELDQANIGRSPEEPPSESTRAVRIPRTDNALIAFTDHELLAIKGLGKGTLSRIRRIPGNVSLVDALAAALGDSDLVQLLADMADDPARYDRIYRSGRAPCIEDSEISEEEFAALIGTQATAESMKVINSREELDAVLGGTLEDWMVFASAEQSQIIEADLNGPSRLAGGPGTGKTVVAIRRALHWAAKPAPGVDTQHRVLLTTFVNTLPPVWKSLLARIDPVAAHRVECRTVDSIAMGLVARGRGVEPLGDLDPRRLRFAKEAADKVGLVSGRISEPKELIGEFDHFITGLGIHDEDTYLERPRTGAGFGLAQPQRQLVFAAYREFKKRMSDEGLIDWPTLRLEALAKALAGDVPPNYRFGGVVVDEAQDLSAVAVQMLNALDTSPNGSRFMLVADARQSIYPGGYRLRDVGIEVGGRSRTLRRNWRNTWWISETVNDLASHCSFEDIEDLPEVSSLSQSSETVGEGTPTTMSVVSGADGEVDELVRLVRQALADGEIDSEICILGWNRAQVARVTQGLRRRGIDAVELEHRNWQTLDAVRVGTVHRSKGLEFKTVMLIGCEQSAHPAAPTEGTSGDRFAANIRLAIVGCSRARDRLHLVSNGDPWFPFSGVAERIEGQ